MRERIMSVSVWTIRAGSRRSGKQRASRPATPSPRSAIASSITPPSEVRRPPSNAAVTGLRETAGNENGRRLSSVMAGEASETSARVGVSNQILSSINALRHPRQLRIPPLMNKMG